MTIVLLIGVVLLILLAIIYKVRSHGTPTNVDRDVWFKIVASSFQVNAITIAAFQWSDAINGYFQVQGDVSSLGIAYFNLACFSSTPSNAFFFETLLFLLSPIVLVVMAGGVAVFDKRNLDKKTLEIALSTAVVVLYLLHPALTSRTADLLACIKMGPAQDDWSSLVCLDRAVTHVFFLCQVSSWRFEHSLLGIIRPQSSTVGSGVPTVRTVRHWCTPCSCRVTVEKQATCQREVGRQPTTDYCLG